MSISQTALGLAVVLFLVVAPPTTTGHEQYSTLGDLLHWYAHAAQTHPSLVRYTEMREPGYEHAVLPLATFTNYGAEAAPGRNKSSVMLVLGEHARELITCEVGLWFSRVLLGDTAEIFSWAEWPEAFKPLGIARESIPATVQGWVRRILDNLVVKVLPVENVDGRQAWEAGNLCLRKTSKGVDLNRNYPFAFAAEPPHSEMFGGPRPFSEAQSRLIARIALEGGPGAVPKAYINVHSGEWAVYSGWDSKAAVGPGLPADLSDLLIRSGDVCRCQAGPAGAVSNYLAYGTGMDFMYTQLGVPYALTYEVYGRAGPFEGGEPGRIPDGTHNKPLSEYPYVTDVGIARTVPRVDDLFGPASHQHHQHQHHLQQHQHHAREAHSARQHSQHNHLFRQQRRARAHAAARLRRSAVDLADEEAGRQGLLAAVAGGAAAAAGEGAGGGRRWGVGSLGGRGEAAETMLRGSEGGGGRNLLGEPLTTASSSSASASSASEATMTATASLLSSFGPLGGRSMRRLAAAATALEAQTEAGGALGGALESGAAGRELRVDLSGYSGPDGPILAMVRRQPGMHQSCFDMFNPPPGAPYRDVISRWVVILLMTLDHVADPAHPRPSPHPLPGTVLAGADAAGTGAAAGTGGFGAGAVGRGFGVNAFGRRRLMEASTASIEAGAEEERADGSDAAQQAGQEGVEGAAATAAGVTAEAGVEVGATREASVGAAAGAGDESNGSGREGENLYGSTSFDRRVQQRVYEVDPVARQHSLVVLVALCCLGMVFVPWFVCATNQLSRPLPASKRRARPQQPAAAAPPPLQARDFI